ncbi:MFS transporter [Clostridiales bacterium BAD-6]|uniref:MFS transporter n=1 Tax=Sinanaerobacter chloroacetimidivorans TaxID=2818044 RepID=A0A8J7W2F6_9FIRM|nr:MFS transporter [Sinanaerobacter chloroacetimidivorans]
MNKVKIGKYEISADLFIFLVISVLLGVVAAVESTSLANRLYEDLDFTVMQRSLLETPRELPGLLAVVFFGMLNGLGDMRIAAVANIIGGIGLLFFGLVPNHFYLVLFFLVIYSVGQHLYLPLSSTIAMGFAEGENFGKRMGQVQGLGSLSIIITSGLLYILYRFFHVTYQVVFVIAAFAMALAGVLFFFIKNGGKKIICEKRFVFHKEFKLYYILSTINGARKQITLTFVPWLIIDVYHQPVTTITMLFFIVCVISIFFKPWFGDLIDKKGERYALQFEAVIMFVACIGFVFAKSLGSFTIALIVVGISYVADKLMESASMARATYVRKHSHDPAEVARTISMGVSMDHLVSMFVPVFAGYVWYSNGPNGYRYVFLGALVISFVNFMIASKLDT